jgi:hypothetical protein
MFFPVSEWFPAFVLTLAVEAPIVAILLRSTGYEALRIAVLFVFANLATHLVVWYVLTDLLVVGTAEYVAVAEGWAIAAEAIFYAAAFREISARRAITVSVVANLASFIAGRVLVGFWPDLLA